MRALERAGVRPDLVCGTSVGALVGAAYATGEFERFCTGTAGMRRRDVLSFTDVGFGGGLLKGQRFMAFVSRGFRDRPIEQLKIPFAAVATSVENGAEDLSYGIVGRGLVVRNADASDTDDSGWLRTSLGRLWPTTNGPHPPSMLDVIASSLDIMQVRAH